MRIEGRVLAVTVGILVAVGGILGMIGGIHQVMEGLGYIRPAEKMGQRYADTSHGCSYLVPEDWDKSDGKNGAVVFRGKRGRNLRVLTEAFPGTLQQYVDASVAQIKKMFPDASVLSDEKMQTEKGSEAVKVMLDNKVEKVGLRQLIACYDGKAGQKIMVVSTVEAGDWGATQPVLDACAKSLELLP